jgi:hypothetical protein
MLFPTFCSRGDGQGVIILTRRKELRRAPSVTALTQRGVESLFPTDVVDGPENLRFVSCGQT